MPSSVAAKPAQAADVAVGMNKDRSSSVWLAKQLTQGFSPASQHTPPTEPTAAAAAAAASATRVHKHAGRATRLHATAASSHGAAAASGTTTSSSKVKGIPESVMQQAYLSKEDPISGRIRCKACGKAFEMYRQLGQHLIEKHDGLNSQDAKFLQLHTSSQQPLQQQQLQLDSSDAFPALGASSSSNFDHSKPGASAGAAASTVPAGVSAQQKLPQQLEQHEGKQHPAPLASLLNKPASGSHLAPKPASKRPSQASSSASKPAPAPAKSLGQFTIFDFIKKPKAARAVTAKPGAVRSQAKSAAKRAQVQLSPDQLAAIMQAAAQQVCRAWHLGLESLDHAVWPIQIPGSFSTSL
jgi:hypothetical protein